MHINIHINHKYKGFTLIEITIVMVVVGLVIGGIMVGRDLIKTSSLRLVLKDIENFNLAVGAFQNKYGCIPGDCGHAVDFFGRFGSCGAWSGSQELGSLTCNGNGNGQITRMNIASPPWWWRYDEGTLFWQQLAFAGLIQGKYTGLIYDSPNTLTLSGTSQNVPKSRVEGGCYSVNSSYSTGGLYCDYPFGKTYNTSAFGNFFALGHPKAYNGTGANTSSCSGGLYTLPAADAKYLDEKIDDGKPFTGKVQSLLDLYGGPSNLSSNVTYPGCLNSNGSYGSAVTTTYDSSAARTACQLFFKAGF